MVLMFFTHNGDSALYCKLNIATHTIIWNNRYYQHCGENLNCLCMYIVIQCSSSGCTSSKAQSVGRAWSGLLTALIECLNILLEYFNFSTRHNKDLCLCSLWSAVSWSMMWTKWKYCNLHCLFHCCMVNNTYKYGRAVIYAVYFTVPWLTTWTDMEVLL